MLCRFPQARFEPLDAPQRQFRLDRVGQPGALGNQTLAFASWPARILRSDRRDRDHPAMPRFAAQPAEQRAHQHLGVKPVGLGPALLTRHRHAAGMNDMGLNPVALQQPGQPEPVAPGFIRHNRARDRSACPCRLLAPSLNLLEQARRVDGQLLQRPPVHPWHRCGHQPGTATHFDHAHQRAIMVESDEGFGQVVGLVMGLLHQCQRNDGASDLVARPIASFAHDGTERRIVRPQDPAEQTDVL